MQDLVTVKRSLELLRRSGFPVDSIKDPGAWARELLDELLCSDRLSDGTRVNAAEWQALRVLATL